MNFDFVTQAAKRMIKHGDIDLVKDDITVHLIYEPYKHDARIAFIADETVKSLSDINHHLPTEGILLKGKTYKDGVFDAADIKFPIIGSDKHNQEIVAIALVHVKTDTIIAIIRTPFLLNHFAFNGGDVIVTWNNSANKIFNIKKDLEEIVL